MPERGNGYEAVLWDNAFGVHDDASGPADDRMLIFAFKQRVLRWQLAISQYSAKGFAAI